jgi:sarcosine oxidase, subunit beta
VTAAPGLPDRVDVVIVGGGIQGLCCAYNLAELGIRRVLVLDAGYFQGGASGRNGTMIRGGFATTEWTRLFHFSNQQWLHLSKKLGRNVMFSRRGYSMIAETDETAAMFERAADVHRRCGVQSSLLSAREVTRILPAIDNTRVRAALHLGDGGVAPHHAAMGALLHACKDRGIRVAYHTSVTGIERLNARVTGVLAGERRILADTVVVAAGGHNLILASMADVAIAGLSMRIEAMALEPIRPLIRPAVALIDSLCYLHQTARGEVVGGTEVPERPRMSLSTDLPVLAATAKVYATMFPQLAQLRVLRHWAGLIHATPDFGPLIGEHPDLKGLWFSAGWSYGYAGGPGAGILLAKAIATGEIDDRIKPFALDRFERECPVHDPAVVLASH